MAHEVFVSYSQPDRDCAFELTEYLEANRVDVWIAPRDVPPSADWAEAIIEAISSARVMVLVFSGSSNGSPQVRREVERAVHKQLRILPFRIEDVVPSGSLEYFLSTQHWLDAFPPPREPHYGKLCSHLCAMLVRRDGAPNAPRPAMARASVALEGAAAEHEPCLPDADLQKLEALLARHIGPIARFLVRRAARAASGTQELIERLAGELDSQDDQRRFVDGCQWLQRPPK
ncbi:MAG: toll/interleukin-1 receptor domain-containing protein [Steroidobacteraceae bacterium]